MRYTKAMKTADFFNRMAALGFSYDEANKLRLIEKTLQRWAELECGDSNNYASWAIERDEGTEKPFMIRHVYGQAGRNGMIGTKDRTIKTPVADREKGALKRLSNIMESHPGLVSYHQTDPRGCALYVLRKSDLNGDSIDSVYTRGFGVCID